MANETVLVIDQNRFARTVLRAIITASYSHLVIIEAESGDQVLKKNLHLAANWIIADYDSTGFDLIQTLNRQNPDAHISIICSKQQETVGSQARSLGYGCIYKPIEENYVLSFFDRIYENSR